MISATGCTSSMRPIDLAAEGQRRLHVAAEVEVHGRAELVHADVLLLLEPGRCARCAAPAGRAGEKRLRNTVSVSAAATMACFQLSCTGDSAADTMRVPICTPSAPRAKAAAIDRPSAMPPAAMTGTSTLRAHQRQQHHRGHVARVLEAAALAALDDQAVDAGVDRLQRRGQRGHDVEHGEPGLLELRGVLRGVAGRGGDEAHALVDHEVDDAGSRTKTWAMFTPNGLSVRSRILRISSRTASSSPDDVSMMPRPPAFGHRRRQLGPGDPAHRRLHDGVADAEQLGDPGATAAAGIAVTGASSSSAAAWTAAMIGSQSAPGWRVTVTKSLTPNRLATPGAASTARCERGRGVGRRR